MKNILAIAVVCGTLTLGISFSACSKKNSNSPTPADTGAIIDTAKTADAVPGAGGLLPQQVADGVSKAVCKRLVVCNPSSGSETDCVTGMSKDMAGSLSDKAKAITQAQLDTCTAGVAKATCDQLSGQSAPTGCEFMN